MQAGRESRRDGSVFHILILFSLAVAWPIFEQVSQSPEFFIARRSGPIDLIVLVLTFILVIPGFVAFAIGLVKRANPEAGVTILLTVLFILFLFLLLIPANRSLDWPSAAILFACSFASLLIVIGYKKYSSIQTFLTFLAPAVLVIPGIFLMNDSISKLIFQKKISFPQIEIQSSTPIVLVIFDEFPLTSLLKDPETIDEELYPNFASLAKTATWYRNATTVSDFTTYAVPAILTGRFPRAEELPMIYDHPSNLFTALGHSYDLIAKEDGERLLPAELDQLKHKEVGLPGRFRSILSDLSILYLHMIFPHELRDRWLPPVDQAWANFGNDFGVIQQSGDDRVHKFRNFIESIELREKPALFYLHTMLPHQPWTFLPSGKVQQCQLGPEYQNYKGFFQCHLLTVGYVDKLVGDLIQRLKQTQIYDRCMLIITADHGESFQIGMARRAVRNNNFRDIMLVPLFIKYPHQQQGEISDANVWTIDILPTIADVLNTEFPWTEGTSILNPVIQNRKSKQFFSGSKHQLLNYEPLMRANPETLAVQKHIIHTDQFQFAWRH
jgi:hypothetical protein